MDVAQATLKTPCPCGSGRPLADCHGKGAPVIAPLPVQLAPDTVTRKLDLACGQSPREGFEGVDRWEGAQHRVNLFKFPWPFGDSSVAELHCSHFIEHIPMIEVYPEDGTPVHYGEGVDLFLRFFDECFRILVPGGWMEVTCPCARHNRAYQDPTHRRFIVSETFLYLSKEFRLTSLARGDGVLRVTAPGYFEESRKLTIGGKRTEVSVPLRGREVPGLGGVLVWSKREGDDLRLDIRLTTAEGVGIEQFPSLPFGAEVRISENLGTLHEPIRGDLLFEGRPKLYLDLSSRLEKLKCKLGWNEIKEPRPGVTFGFLDFVLHTDQGTFRTTRGDIPLGKEGS